MAALTPLVGLTALVGATLSEGTPRLVAASVVVLAALAYGAGRSGHAVVAGVLASVAAMVFPYFGVGSEAATTSMVTELSLMLMVPVVAGLCLSLRPLVAILALHLAASFGLMLQNPGIPTSGAGLVLLYCALASVLVLVWAAIRRRNERALAEAAVAEVERVRSAELEAVNARLRETQARLVQAGKLAALGELSASVAHEINTPLMGITMCAEFLAEDFKDEHGAPPEMVARILDAAQRCERIVEGLLHFGRRGDGERQAVDLDAVVGAALGLVGARLEKDGTRVVRMGDRPLPVLGDSVALSQVVLNLLLNAAQAMPGGGLVEVEGSLDVDEVLLVVRDRGPGVPAELAERIFEPFFTTKESGPASA